jgi:FxsC-like protein
VHRGYASATTAAPYFFLSYAHNSRLDAGGQSGADFWVGKLFEDLRQRVRQRGSLPPGANPGFMGAERRAGEEWPSALTYALATCRVFVPLYSASYFGDDHCGREWAYFVSRARNRDGRWPEPGAAIVPGVWDPVEPSQLPSVARSFQPEYVGSDAYASLGLYGIAKLARFRRDYEDAVLDLSRRIVSAAEVAPAEKGQPPDFGALESAFSQSDQTPAGVRRLRITVVSPRSDELPDGRKDLRYYGSSALDWNPYAPDFDVPIARHAAAVARDLGFSAELGDLDQHQAALLAGERPTGPQILIIDPWALLVPHSQHLLELIDARRTPWVQAVIPWGAEDGESREAAEKLRVARSASFQHKLAEVASVSELAAEGVPTVNEFGLVLRQLILAAAKRYLGVAAARRPAGQVAERPRVSRSAQHPG